MTLCIAAKTYESYDTDFAQGSVITCSDHRVETPTAAADVAYKTRMTRDYQWEIMMAGTLPLALELTDVFAEDLRKSIVSGVAVIERLRQPIDIFRNRVAERFARSRYAISAEEFRATGGMWLGDQLFREALRDMQEYILGEEKQIQLLLIGCDDEGFLAIYKYSYGELWECDGFAAIGSGETIAEATLYRRGIEESRSFMEVAYAVYEAKRLGEITPGVGPTTSLGVFDIDEVAKGESYLRWRHVSNLSFLERQFEMFGPRPYEHVVPPKDYLGMSDQGQGYRLWPVKRVVISTPQPTTPAPSGQPPSPE